MSNIIDIYNIYYLLNCTKQCCKYGYLEYNGSMKYSLEEKQREKFIDLCRKGKTIKEISFEMGVKQYIVSVWKRYLKKQGVVLTYNLPEPE